MSQQEFVNVYKTEMCENPPPLQNNKRRVCQNIIALKYYQNVELFLSPTAVGTDPRADNMRDRFVCIKRREVLSSKKRLLAVMLMTGAMSQSLAACGGGSSNPVYASTRPAAIRLAPPPAALLDVIRRRSGFRVLELR